MYARHLVPLTLALVLAGPADSPAQVRYEFEGATLTRHEGDAVCTIGCTEPGGTGTIRDLARGPHGTVYVAADAGLFALHDDVRHTTRLQLGPGAPPGVPTAVLVAARGTIWLGTDRAFGCVEPVHLFGQTLSSVLGWPRERVLDIAREADGALAVTTASARRRYRPDDSPAPRVAILAGDERPVDGTVRVRLQGTTVGRTIFGYRLGSRHRFRTQPTGAFEIRGLEPGRHELRFVVFDQDLRRSEPVAHQVVVPYPKAFDKRVLVPATLVLFGLVLLGMLHSARRRGGGRVRYGKAALSAILLFAVGLQVVAGLVPHGRSWPIVGYSMYTERHVALEHIHTPAVIGVFEDGSRRPIDPGRIGYTADGYWQTLLPLVYDGEERRRRFLIEWNHKIPEKLRGFVVVDRKKRLTSQGPIDVAPIVMCAHSAGAVRDR